jgi:predicted DNA-binding transcriptional regulator AlpA
MEIVMLALEQVEDLPKEGFVRLSQFLGRGRALPIGRSTWWAGVKSGRFPQPVKLLPGVTVWRVDDIRAVIDKSRQEAC